MSNAFPAIAHLGSLRLAVLGLLWATFTAVAAGCTPHAFSPPARIAPLDTARPSGAGSTGVQVAGSSFSELFGVEAESVGLQVRHGLSEQLDLVGNVDLVHITQQGAADVHPNIYSGRAGVHWAPAALEDNLAVTAGVGGGGHAAGGFLSPDVGLIVAYENDYVVPFVAGSALVSVPVGASAVDLSEEGDALGTDVQTPATTWGAIATLGVKIPVRFGPEASPTGGGVSLALSFTWLADDAEKATITGITPGIGLTF